MRSRAVLAMLGLLAVGLATVVPIGAADTAATIDVLKCQVEANRDVEVGSRIEGELVEVKVKEGQTVKAGDVLARLEDTEARLTRQVRQLEADSNAAIESATQSLEAAKVEHEINTKLQKKGDGYISRLEYLRSQIKVKLQEAELQRVKDEKSVARLMVKVAESRLRDHEIRAPIGGVVADLLRDVGEAVRAREPVFGIIDTAKVKVLGWLEVKHLRRVQVGQSVRLRLQIEPEREYRGRIVFVDPEVDPAAHRFQVKAEVDNPTGRIHPGLVARMTIHCAASPGKSGTTPKP